jgi:hypothetical protein
VPDTRRMRLSRAETAPRVLAEAKREVGIKQTYINNLIFWTILGMKNMAEMVKICVPGSQMDLVHR